MRGFDKLRMRGFDKLRMREVQEILILSLSKDEDFRHRHPMDKTTHVYMVRCSDGSFYVGSHRGSDPEQRVASHNLGLDPKAYTYRRRPVLLVWSEWFEDAVSAIAVERQIKGWSRAKKLALIRGDWAEIQKLAHSATPRPRRDPFAAD